MLFSCWNLSIKFDFFYLQNTFICCCSSWSYRSKSEHRCLYLQEASWYSCRFSSCLCRGFQQLNRLSRSTFGVGRASPSFFTCHCLHCPSCFPSPRADSAACQVHPSAG